MSKRATTDDGDDSGSDVDARGLTETRKKSRTLVPPSAGDIEGGGGGAVVPSSAVSDTEDVVASGAGAVAARGRRHRADDDDDDSSDDDDYGSDDSEFGSSNSDDSDSDGDDDSDDDDSDSDDDDSDDDEKDERASDDDDDDEDADDDDDERASSTRAARVIDGDDIEISEHMQCDEVKSEALRERAVRQFPELRRLLRVLRRVPGVRLLGGPRSYTGVEEHERLPSDHAAADGYVFINSNELTAVGNGRAACAACVNLQYGALRDDPPDCSAALPPDGDAAVPRVRYNFSASNQRVSPQRTVVVAKAIVAALRAAAFTVHNEAAFAGAGDDVKIAQSICVGLEPPAVVASAPAAAATLGASF